MDEAERAERRAQHKAAAQEQLAARCGTGDGSNSLHMYAAQCDRGFIEILLDPGFSIDTAGVMQRPPIMSIDPDMAEELIADLQRMIPVARAAEREARRARSEREARGQQ
jgi:hypothetical protein